MYLSLYLTLCHYSCCILCLALALFSHSQVANEKFQTDTGNIVDSIVPGMWNLYYALKTRGLDGKIKVTTPQHPGLLTTPYPPSHATVSAAFGAKWKKLLDFLDKTGTDAVRWLYGHTAPAVRAKCSVRTEIVRKLHRGDCSLIAGGGSRDIRCSDQWSR